MNMVTKTKYLKSDKKRNVTQIAYIQYQLKRNGFTQRDIALDLGICEQAVSRAIRKQSQITRVDEWLRDNLGLEVVNG